MTQVFLHSYILFSRPIPFFSHIFASNNTLISYGDSNNSQCIHIRDLSEDHVPNRNDIKYSGSVIKIHIPEILPREKHLIVEWIDSNAPANYSTFFIIGGYQTASMQKVKKKKDFSLSDCWRITFDKNELFGASSVLLNKNLLWQEENAVPVVLNYAKYLKKFHVKREKELPFSIFGHSGCIRKSYKPEIWIFGGFTKKSQRGSFLVFSDGSWHIVQPKTTFPTSERISHTLEFRQKSNSIILYGGIFQGKNNKNTNEIWEFFITEETWKCIEHSSDTSIAKNSTSKTDPEQSNINHQENENSNHTQESNEIKYNVDKPSVENLTYGILLGNDLLLIHEESSSNIGVLFIYNLEINTWRKLRVEGCPPDSQFKYQLVRNSPRRFLMIGEETYLLEVMQNLKRVREISDELQTQISTKDVAFHFVEQTENQLIREEESYSARRRRNSFQLNTKENSSILCHKVIMIQSPVLKEIIKNSSTLSSIHETITNVTLNCSKNLFELVVQYLYGSHPMLTIENVIPLMSQAQLFKLESLRDYCLQRVIGIFNSDNIIDYTIQAYENDLQNLLDVSIRYICKNFKFLLEHNPKFSQLPSKVLYQILKIRESIEPLPNTPIEMNSITNPLHALQKHIVKVKKGGYQHDFILRASDGRSFKVHKSILSVRSQYFQQIIKESKTNKYVFNSNSDIVINGKFLNIILEEIYGLFLSNEGTSASRSLYVEEMMELIEICLHIQLINLADSILYQLSYSIKEEYAIQILEFAVRLKNEYELASELQNLPIVKDESIRAIRKPQTDLEYGIMMSKFFEAKIELMNEEKQRSSSLNGSKMWNEVLKFPGERMMRTPKREKYNNNESDEEESNSGSPNPITPRRNKPSQFSYFSDHER